MPAPFEALGEYRPHGTVGLKELRTWLVGSQVAMGAAKLNGFETIAMNSAEVFAAGQSGAVDVAVCCTRQPTYPIFIRSDGDRSYVLYNAFARDPAHDPSKNGWVKLNDEQPAPFRAAYDRAATSAIYKVAIGPEDLEALAADIGGQHAGFEDSGLGALEMLIVPLFAGDMLDLYDGASFLDDLQYR